MARGHLWIELGAAPGVGKTFAMLNEGRRRYERGTDVVVGYVETHGRAKTAEQIGDLEVIPRRRLEYRGQTFEEMDVDAILARKPAQVLVDELAHTNVPGSRHEKRWQDIHEILDAGIDVISTVNIQHLESLNDVVEQITGIKQRETVPDAVVRDADQIYLIDMTPEALRRRMAHGNIYPAERIDTALAHYFREGNLGALRELALLWMADRVDEALHDYRERHGIAAPWETKERVVVALTGHPAGDDLIRRAARIAMRTKGELVGVHVQSGDGLAGPSTAALERQRELLDELDGRFVEVSGQDVATALVQVARAENATQIILGASNRSRWSELTRGSIINSVIRQSGNAIDVHVISTARSDDVGTATTGAALLRPQRRRLASVSRRRQLIAVAIALLGLPLLTVALTPVRDTLGLHNTLLAFLMVVVVVATVGGLWPALLASVLGFLFVNWFFVEPLHTLTINHGRDLLALVAFLAVGGVISALVDLAARRRNDAYRARTEAQALARMAAVVLREPEPLPHLVADLAATFRLEGVAVLRTTREGWRVEAAAGPTPPRSPAEGTLSIPLADDVSLLLRGESLEAADREVLNAFATQLGVALENRRLQDEAANVEALERGNELRTALLAAVSHDLRTPLASIKAAATSLLSSDIALDQDAVHALLETINGETDRLNTLVGNLLDMSRLQTGALVVQSSEVGVDEVVAMAMAGLAHVDRVEVDVAETLPPVKADAALLERALANLLDNAMAFSPPDKPVRVRAGRAPGRIEVRVIDQGRGIAPADRERVFQPFQRLGDNPNGEGVGLGMAVAKGFIEAMDGDLSLEDTPGGGCTAIVSLPESSTLHPSVGASR